MSLEQELTGSGQADPYAVKHYWTEVVRSAYDRGKLEKIPTRMASTTRERDQARAQNAAITTKSFGGWGNNYDRIFRQKDSPNGG